MRKTGPEHGRRGEVLAALRAATSAASILDLAAELGFHPNTVRFHLDALVATGQAERCDEAPRVGPGRPPQMFRARRGMDPSGSRNYRLLAEILAAQLGDGPDASDRALAAGRAWGRRMTTTADNMSVTAHEAIDGLVRMLDDLGFAPESDRAGRVTRIMLRRCPFLEMSRVGTDVVCSIHLGLMRGALDGRSAPVTVDALTPFAEPDMCLVHLSPTARGFP